jgi:hypothetical protein
MKEQLLLSMISTPQSNRNDKTGVDGGEFVAAVC